MTTPITASQFRADFPEFGNVTKYPDAKITLWASVAPYLLDPTRWGNLYELGQELFIAHNVALDGMSQQDASRTGLVGFAKGPVTQEGGDKVSVSYAAAQAMLPNAGHWNMTTYGQRYWMLLNMAGMGPVQVSPSPFGGGAQSGPYGWNWGNPSNMQF